MSKAQESLIARRYAKAFYALADEQKKIDVIVRDVRSLQDMPESPELCQFLQNPLVKRSQKTTVMLAIAQKAGLDRLTSNFLGVIAENGRLALLPHVINAVAAEIAARRGEITAEITSARALDADQVKKLAETLRKVTGTDVDVVLKEDESILGGLKIKVGSLMIDQSVKTRLDRLERTLKSDGGNKERSELRDAA